MQTVELHVAQGIYDPYAVEGEQLHMRANPVSPSSSLTTGWQTVEWIWTDALRNKSSDTLLHVQDYMHRIAISGKELACRKLLLLAMCC